MKISNENIEEYLLLLADKELSSQEEEQVRLYVSANETWKPVMDAYLAACLDDTEAFVFPDKEMLLQPEEPAVAIPLKRKSLPVWRIAAAVAVLIGLGFTMNVLLNPDNAANDEVIAKHDTKVQRPATKAPSVPANVTGQPLAVVPAVAVHKNDAPHRSAAKVPPTQQQLAASVVYASRKGEIPETLESSALHTVPVSLGAKAERLVMVAQEQVVAIQEEHKGLPVWLPINEENLQGVNVLISHIQDLKENIQEKAASLRNTAFVIRIGERQIPINK